MTPEDYQQQVRRTLSGDYLSMLCELQNGDDPDPRRLDILHAAIGCGTESGELLDAVKKVIFYNRELDVNNLIEETGDLLWYIATLCNALDVTMSHCMELNIAKLKKRYPEKFTTENAINRDVIAERNVFDT